MTSNPGHATAVARGDVQEAGWPASVDVVLARFCRLRRIGDRQGLGPARARYADSSAVERDSIHPEEHVAGEHARRRSTNVSFRRDKLRDVYVTGYDRALWSVLTDRFGFERRTR